VVGRQNAEIADTRPASKGRCHGNNFLAFYIWGAHWHHLANTSEPSICGSDAALCQITLTTCYIIRPHRMRPIVRPTDRLA